MLEKLQSFFESREVDGEIRESLYTLTESVERMKIASRRQLRIEDFFQ